ncbi:hypothetical protein [Frigoribacterium salinisoli]
MTSDLDNRGGRAERAAHRPYYRDLTLGMVAYGLLLAAAIAFGDLEGDSPWRFAWALLPVLPLAFVLVAVVRLLPRLDEYQRQLQLQALATGFGAAVLAALATGFLAFAGLQGWWSSWVVLTVGMLGWAVGGVVARAR